MPPEAPVIKASGLFVGSRLIVNMLSLAGATRYDAAMLARMIPRSPFDVHLRLFAFPLRVHWTFWLATLLLSADMKVPSLVLATVLLIMLSIVVHEMGHAFAARHYEKRVDEIILYALGGLCVHEGGWLQPWKNIRIALAGPLFGFALSGVFAALFFTVGANAPWLVRAILYEGLWFNVAVNAINLLPIFPLDGGQIFREYMQWKHPDRDDVFVFRVSFVTALVAIGLSIAGVGFLHLNYMGIFIFAGLAINSWYLLHQMKQMGISNIPTGGDDDDSAPRQPWEQDPDRWKKR
jgi:Zn-dependent protease